MSAAGAQTQQCFSFKVQGDTCSCEALNPAGGDAACPTFNTGIPGACPVPLSSVVTFTPPDCNAENIVITPAAGCTLQFVGFKGGDDCVIVCDNNAGTTPGPCGGSATVTSSNLSHITIAVCCGS
jgi:hypothetical protein